MDRLHEGIYSGSDGHPDHLMEMYCQGDFMESFENKKLKRRESDAKCRANITAGFDLLKEQVYASGSQEKVSKETILHQSFVRVKYLEGVLIALQHTKEISNGTKEKLQEVSPLQQLRDIHHQFVAFQQRKWNHGLPAQRPANDTPRTPNDRQGGIRRMTKRRRPKHKSLKKSPLLVKRKKCSPIIHLPPALHTPSRPQKRIKLASTEASMDQVVPLSSILHPALKIPLLSSTKKGTRRGRAGSQTVPDSPHGRKEDMQQENIYTNETGAPSSPMIDVCTTPCKVGLLRGSSVISTPMKTYQIVGTSITPVKIAYHVESEKDSEEVPGSRDLTSTPDLVCDEEPTSWPEDESSSSSGSIPELHISHPWFSTPVRPTGLSTGNQTPVPSVKHQRPPSRPPVLEPQVGQKETVDDKKKELFKEFSGGDVLKENANGTNLKKQEKCTTPRKKYRKRATAARVRAWDSATGRVLSPVQPYSGVFKAIQQRKIDVSTKSKSPAVDTNSPWGYLGQKLPASGFDAPIRPMSSIVREGLVERLNSDIVYITDFTEESDDEIIDLLGSDSAKASSYPRSSRPDNVPTPCLDHNHAADDSSPACLRDVSIPPPTGTISPPSLARHSSMGYDESPELFKGFRSLLVRDLKGDSCIAVESGTEMECCQHLNNEGGFYDYHHQTRCDPDDAAMMGEEDLFEADLGDMRHLDPALQPPSSSLDSQDYIIRLRRDELEELDRIDVMSDADKTCGISRHKKRALTPALLTNDGLITPALASFATSALSMKHTRRTNTKGQRRRRNVRLNLPKASSASDEEDDDLNIWKFTRAALNEKDVFGFLPTDSSYTLITNNY